MSTKYTKKEGTSSAANNSTTIRINQSTKERLENLDFVRKHTFDEILSELMEFYETSKSKDFDGLQKLKISERNKKEVNKK